jgi:Mg2+ and Co2+ transporter CorA
MIRIIEDFDELKKEIDTLNLGFNINEIIKFDAPLVEDQDNFTLINIPSYNDENPRNLIFVSEKKIFVHSSLRQGKIDKKMEKLLKKKNGESTVIIFLLLKSVIKNYSREFVRIREEMNKLDLNPIFDSVENVGRDLRKLTDRMEGLMQIVIELKEEEIECFNTSLINFDYDLLNAETRYWLERCRSHVYRIASLRAKSEMKSNMELNETMKKLTVIMTFLTIVSIVVNVPGTIGAIFGIPALSDAYFNSHTGFLVFTLVLTTLLSVLLGFVYWKSLGLKGT